MKQNRLKYFEAKKILKFLHSTYVENTDVFIEKEYVFKKTKHRKVVVKTKLGQNSNCVDTHLLIHTTYKGSNGKTYWSYTKYLITPKENYKGINYCFIGSGTYPDFFTNSEKE